MKRPILIDIISILFMILFLYTGISKLLDYNVFKAQLEESPVLATVAPLLAWALPLIEIILTVLLLIPRWRAKGLYGSLALMIIFTSYVIALVTFSDKLPCSCGGILSQLSWQQHIIFNSAFTLLAGWALLLYRKISNSSLSTSASKIN